MPIVNVVLPEAVTEWVEAQTATNRFGTVSDYVEDLIRRERDRVDRLDAVRRFVDEGDASGISPRDVTDVFAEAREIAERRGFPA